MPRWTKFGGEEFLVNEAIEVDLDKGDAVVTRYEIPVADR
jgi:hypothetical protein